MKEASEADFLASDKMLSFQFVDCQEFVTIKSIITVIIVICSSVVDSCTAHIDFWVGELQIPSTQPLPSLHYSINVDTRPVIHANAVIIHTLALPALESAIRYKSTLFNIFQYSPTYTCTSPSPHQSPTNSPFILKSVDNFFGHIFPQLSPE